MIDRARLLLSRGRRTSTKVSYAGKWQRFVDFCSTILPQVYGQKARAALPAAPRTVLLYMAHLSAEGSVSEKSLNPYLAAINQAHEDLGLPRPALGHGFRLLRAGFREVEGEERDAEADRSVRMPVPADVIFDILRFGLTTIDPSCLRKAACVVLCYCWYNRADSGVLLQRQHVTFDRRGITVNSLSKTMPRNLACPVHRPHSCRFDPGGLVLQLLLRWHHYSAAWQRPHDCYWSLSSDPPAFRASVIGTWLNDLLPLVQHAPPTGESWTGHSLRSGGASASLAIGVPLFYIMQHGLWKSLQSVQQYLSLVVKHSPAAWLFFGWMLPPSAPSVQ